MTEMAFTMLTDTVASFDTIYENAIKTFRELFNAEADVASCAPGRVNLIGEHIDYNDGYVLPMALPMVTLIVGRRKDGQTSTVNIATYCDGADDPKHIEFDLKCLMSTTTPKWANYVKGVIHCYGKVLPAFDAVIMTNVPIGGGLSSSAALEVATLTFIEALADPMKQQTLLCEKEKALVCQRAEHEFAGMPCGIMDQLISIMGRRDHALLIDCQSLETLQIPFETDDLAILICNSNVRHELSHSEYPTRRKQCEKALELMGLQSYKDATIKSLDALKDFDEVLTKRARHVVTEIQRTIEAAEALKRRDFKKMGQLMYESHKSLRDDFEVSCKELDVLVEAAINCTPSVLGSRMTGGGFGGCTITLLHKQDINNVITHIRTIYDRSTVAAATTTTTPAADGSKTQITGTTTDGRSASFFVCQPSDGARLINLA